MLLCGKEITNMEYDKIITKFAQSAYCGECAIVVHWPS